MTFKLLNIRVSIITPVVTLIALSLFCIFIKPSTQSYYTNVSYYLGFVGILHVISLRSNLFKRLIPFFIDVSIGIVIFSLLFLVFQFASWCKNYTIKIEPRNVATTAITVLEDNEKEKVEPSIIGTPLSPLDLENEGKSVNHQIFNPSINDDKLYEVFFVREPYIANINNPSSKVNSLYDYTALFSAKLIGTSQSTEYAILNANEEYTTSINKAKEIVVPPFLDKNAVNVYTEIIRLREKAHQIGKTRALTLLLARDCYELGRVYAIQNSNTEAFNYYIKSLEYYFESIRLMSDNQKYEVPITDVYYYIGQVYHHLGDLPYLEKTIRADAYCMGLSFLNLSCERKVNHFDSVYYTGMIAHKLGVVFKSESYIFLGIAVSMYNNAMIETYDSKTKADLFSFLAHTYTKSMNYISKYGTIDGMLSFEEYKQKRDAMIAEEKNIRRKIAFK